MLRPMAWSNFHEIVAPPLVDTYSSQVAGIDSIIFEDRFLSPEFFEDPYPYYRYLLDNDPVVWSDKVRGWLVSSFEDVQSGLQNSTVFGSGGRIDEAAQSLSEQAREENAVALDCLNAMMSFRDAPDHTRLRRLVSKAFTARRVAGFEPQIQKIVDELLDSWPRGQDFDLVETFSFPLPAMVICRMLGIPDERLGDINRWADGIVNLLSAGVMTETAARNASTVVTEASSYLSQLIDEKRSHPGDDLLSALVVLEEDEESLSRGELIAMIIQLFFAGFETTEGLIGNALSVLLAQADTFEELAGNRDFAEWTTEEALRFDNSIQRQTRVARADVYVQDVLIPQGSYVFFLIGAANRDPRRFDRPDVFDPSRADLGSVAFGHGAHFCLGAPLARLETRIALQSIAERYPGLQMAAKPTYGSLLAVRKPKSLMLHIG